MYVCYYLSGVQFCGISLAYFFGSTLPNLDAANASLPIFTTICMLFAGFWLTTEEIPDYWGWFSYLSVLILIWNPPTPPGSTGCESPAGRLPLVPLTSGNQWSRGPPPVPGSRLAAFGPTGATRCMFSAQKPPAGRLSG